MTKKVIFFIFTVFISANIFAGMGKVVFSKSPIDATTGESLSPATFDITDKIYCRLFLSKGLNKHKNLMGERASFFRVRVKLDGKPENLSFYHLNTVNCKSPDECSATTFEFILNENADKTIVNTKFANELNKLSSGQHTVSVEVTVKESEGKEFIAVGEFFYVKSENSKLKIGVSFDNEVKAKMTDATLEAKALKVLTDDSFEKYSVNGSGYKEKYKLDVLKLKIISEDWSITKHPKTGVITGRYITVAVQAKVAGSCVIYVYKMEQQYNGSGYQDSFGGYVGPAYEDKLTLHRLHRKPVDCE